MNSTIVITRYGRVIKPVHRYGFEMGIERKTCVEIGESTVNGDEPKASSLSTEQLIVQIKKYILKNQEEKGLGKQKSIITLLPYCVEYIKRGQVEKFENMALKKIVEFETDPIASENLRECLKKTKEEILEIQQKRNAQVVEQPEERIEYNEEYNCFQYWKDYINPIPEIEIQSPIITMDDPAVEYYFPLDFLYGYSGQVSVFSNSSKTSGIWFDQYNQNEKYIYRSTAKKTYRKTDKYLLNKNHIVVMNPYDISIKENGNRMFPLSKIYKASEIN